MGIKGKFTALLVSTIIASTFYGTGAILANPSSTSITEETPSFATSTSQSGQVEPLEQTTQTPISTLIEEGNYANLLNELTQLINQRVGGQTDRESLINILGDANFAKTIAERELLSKVGTSTIQDFAANSEKKVFIDWLLDNTEAMNLLLESGLPTTTYSKALNVWYEIWSKDADSRTGYELKLAIASALEFGDGVPKWYTSRTLVTPYERYEYYKLREAEGKFPVSMKGRTVWDLRGTINAPVSNEDLDYIRDVIHANRYDATKQTVSIEYPPYTSKSKYTDEDGNPYSIFSASGDQFYGPNATIKDVYELGGVCGALSTYASVANNSFGIPGFLVGQPGHAAHVYSSPTEAGKWGLGYDIYYWGKSFYNPRNGIPYTSYADVINRVPYLFVYEAARANETALRQSFQLKWVADALRGYTEAQAVRQVAMQMNKWNIDLSRDYLNAMKNITGQALAAKQVPASNMTVTATSSNRSYTPNKAIDGNNQTYWVTQYEGQRSYLPQSITLTFDQVYEINKFSYIPRPAGGSENGNITEYKLYGSVDGVNYDVLATGTWANDFNEKFVGFASTGVKYLKLEALQGVGSYAAASELKVYQPVDDMPISQAQWAETAHAIINNYKEQPEVVFDLFRLIQSYVLNSETPREVYQQYLVDLYAVLDQSTLDGKQKSITDELRPYLSALNLADFNFDGDHAGQLVGGKTDTEYSLDGGITWKPISTDNMKLSDEELALISADYGIRVRLMGTDASFLIPITKAPSLPKIYANDDMNKVFNMNTNVYYSIDQGATWTKYENDDRLPDLTGDLDFMVKIPATGKTLGSEIQTFTFSSKVDASLILPSDLAGLEADAYKNNPATYAYDGNVSTIWHSDYETVKTPLPLSLNIELKNESNLYKLEYIPRQDSSSNGVITEYNIYTSEDGQNFTHVSTGQWANDKQTKTAIFNAPNTKYVKFEAVKGSGNYASAAEIKLYKTDVLSIPHITFSFDGANAGKLEGSNTDMEYSMDAGATWNAVTGVNMSLSSADLGNIHPDSIIQVRYKNAAEFTEISFIAASQTPNVTGNDIENTIEGLDNTMDYSIDNGVTWTRYNGTLNVDLKGNVELCVRIAATGTTLAGPEVVLHYTAQLANDFENRVLYKVISKVSGKAISVNGGSNAENVNSIPWGFSGSNNQIMYFVAVGENEYRIEMRHSGKVLSPMNLSATEGAELAQTTYSGLDTQKWKLVSLGNQEYQVINVATGYALTAEGNTVVNKKLVHSSSQVWMISYAQDVTVPNVNFSFDGDIAGKIMGIDRTMEYSLDSGSTWKTATAADLQLTAAELSSIGGDNDIKVRVIGNSGIATIDIAPVPSAPEVKMNDESNGVVGIDETMEYSVNNGLAWIRYDGTNSPNLQGRVSVLARHFGYGLVPVGATTKLEFFHPTLSTLPVFDLRFDGNWNESVSNTQVTPVGEPAFIEGASRQAVQFAAGTYADLGKSADLSFGSTDDFTVSFWIKSAGVTGDPVILSNKNWNSGNNQGLVIAMNDKGSILWNYKTSVGTRVDASIPKVADDQWHHILIAHDRDGNATLYKDGVLVSSVDISERMGNIDSAFSYKVGQDGTGNYKHGLHAGIDDLKIYKYNVTADQAKQIYDAVVANEQPEIHGVSDVTLQLGDPFDPLAGVTATDKEDGILTNDIVVTGQVNTAVEGQYTLTYRVTDRQGVTTTVDRIIKVEKRRAVISGATDSTIPIFRESFDPLAGVTAYDTEDGDLTSKIVVTGSVNNEKAGPYSMRYEVTNSQGTLTTVTRIITVEQAVTEGESWDSNKVYVEGDIVTYQGVKYAAKWWVQGQAPDTTEAWELVK